MNLIIWLVVGGVIGWVASLIMKTDAQQGMILNVVVGIVGALLGGWLLSPLVGAGTVNQGDFSLMGLLVSLVPGVWSHFFSDDPQVLAFAVFLGALRDGADAWILAPWVVWDERA